MNNISNMSEHSSFFENVKKIYNKESYLDKYGGSVVVTGLTIFVFFLIFSYFYINNHLSSLKANWNVNKCNPAVIPFAGLINSKTW